MISGVILALLMQISSFGGSLTAQTNVIVMILASLGWASGLYLSLPASLDGGQLHMKVIRLLCIVSQWLWPMIFIGSWSLQGSSTGWSVAILKLITTLWLVLAVIGIVGIMCFLSMASKDLYMRRCSSRFQLLAVGFPLYVIVASLILSPAYIMSGAVYSVRIRDEPGDQGDVGRAMVDNSFAASVVFSAVAQQGELVCSYPRQHGHAFGASRCKT